MSNAIVPYNDQERMAQAIAKSQLFGLKNPDQVLALMAVAQAEGRHPGSVARDYHIIQGRPALRADAMLARFQQAGGSVRWIKYADEEVKAEFSHPQGGSLTLSWTFEQAKRIGLTSKDNWRNYPRAMLRARVISEGIRTVYPGVLTGEYTPEEVMDFSPAQEVPRVEIDDEIVVDGIALYVPEPDGNIKLYKMCVGEEDWCDTYFSLLERVRESKRMTDEEKSQKILQLTDANRESVDKYVMKNEVQDVEL
jgi:hypothetical protein